MSVAEKFKSNFIAFVVGALASGGTVLSVVDSLHKKEITIIEREKADLQRRLADTEALLKAQTVTPKVTAPIADSSPTRKQEIEALIQNLDKEIKAKKEELGRNAPVTVDAPKDEGYMRVESELRSLQHQRDNARQRLIEVVGGKS